MAHPIFISASLCAGVRQEASYTLILWARNNLCALDFSIVRASRGVIATYLVIGEAVARSDIDQTEVTVRTVQAAFEHAIVVNRHASTGKGAETGMDAPDTYVRVPADVIPPDYGSICTEKEHRRCSKVRGAQPLIAGDVIVLDKPNSTESQLNAVRGEIRLRKGLTDHVVMDIADNVSVTNNPGLLPVLEHVVCYLHCLRIGMSPVKRGVTYFDGVAFLAAARTLIDAVDRVVRDAARGAVKHDSAQPIPATIADICKSAGIDDEPRDMRDCPAILDHAAAEMIAPRIDGGDRIVLPVERKTIRDEDRYVGGTVGIKQHRHPDGGKAARRLRWCTRNAKQANYRCHTCN